MTGHIREDGTFARETGGVLYLFSLSYNDVSSTVDDTSRVTMWRFGIVVRGFRDDSAAGWRNKDGFVTGTGRRRFGSPETETSLSIVHWAVVIACMDGAAPAAPSSERLPSQWAGLVSQAWTRPCAVAPNGPPPAASYSPWRSPTPASRPRPHRHRRMRDFRTTRRWVR